VFGMCWLPALCWWDTLPLSSAQWSCYIRCATAHNLQVYFADVLVAGVAVCHLTKLGVVQILSYLGCWRTTPRQQLELLTCEAPALGCVV
jgi:hypothetical protein